MKRALTLAALGTVVVLFWRRNPRMGTRLMNEVVNPYLMRHDFSSGRHAEAATLEHVGRRTGTRRLTLVHPVATDDGFRIIVPLGSKSEWARNVLAAGHCRMYLRSTVYELDEPTWLDPGQFEGLPPAIRAIQGVLGLKHLWLRRFATRPGTPDTMVAERGDGGEEALALATTAH